MNGIIYFLVHVKNNNVILVSVANPGSNAVEILDKPE